MKRPTPGAKVSSLRGIRVWSVLAVALMLVVGVILATVKSSPDIPARTATPRDLLSEAKIAFAGGDYGEAEKILRTLPGNEAKSLLGRVLVRGGRMEEAFRILGEVLRQDPKDFEATRAMAFAAQRLGRLDQAVLLWTRATALNKADPEVWRELALCHREKGDVLGAMTAIQESLALNPTQPDLSNILTELALGQDPSKGSLPGGMRKPALPGSPRTQELPMVLRGAPVPDPAANFARPQGRSR